MFHPLLVFDALSGQLITALLRHGRAHAAKGAITILTRLIRAIRRRCPRASLLVRGDSAFAMPKLLDRLEQLTAELGDVEYVIGVAKNSRLLAFAELCGPLWKRNSSTASGSFAALPGCRTRRRRGPPSVR